MSSIITHILSILHIYTGAGKKTNRHSAFGKNPNRDWQIIVAVFVVVNILLIAADFYLFKGVNRGEVFLSEKKPAAIEQILDRKKLDQLIEQYDANQKQLQSGVGRGPSVADPSL